MGGLTIGGNTLSITGGGSGPNSAYTLTAGSVTLTGNATFDVADNGTGLGKLILGSIGDDGNSRSLTKTDNGTLVLSGTDTYTGGTVVDAGTLVATSSVSLPHGTKLTVAAGGTFVFDPSQAPAGSPVVGSAVTAGAVAAVPEPGTLALLIAALSAGFGAWRRRR